MARKMSRRDFLKFLGAGAGGAVLVSCIRETPEPAKTSEPIEVTRIVGGTPVVVTATPEPTKPPEAVADVLGTFPRRETVLVRQLTGRVGTPDNMNLWVGWKWQDRGLQNLADEPLWSVDFATGKIINGLADGDAKYNADFTECTIPLRKGVAWNDGEPFTAADVVFTIETLMKYTGFNANSKFVDGRRLCDRC